MKCIVKFQKKKSGNVVSANGGGQNNARTIVCEALKVKSLK